MNPPTESDELPSTTAATGTTPHAAEWTEACAYISEMLPHLGMNLISAAVTKTNGDRVKAVGMLLDGSFVQDALNGDDDEDKGKGININGWEGGDYDRTPPGGCSDDFILALQMQKEWMEEEQARKAVECKMADKDIFKCIICMDDCCTAEEMYNVEECGHAFCKSCMRGYVQVQIHQRESISAKDIMAQQRRAMAVSPDEELYGSSGEADQDAQNIDLYFRIKCPHTTCEHYLDYFEIKQCVDASQLALLDQITLNRVHSFVPTLQWCIGCGSTVIVHDKSSKFVQCDNPVCKLTYCIVCREAHKDKYTCAHFQARKRKRVGNQRDNNRDKIKHPKVSLNAATPPVSGSMGEGDADADGESIGEEEDDSTKPTPKASPTSTTADPSSVASSVAVSRNGYGVHGAQHQQQQQQQQQHNAREEEEESSKQQQHAVTSQTM